MDDLIRRQDAIEAIRKRVETLSRDEQFVKEGGYIDGFDTVNDWIEYGEWRVTAWMPIEPYREDGAHEVNRR